MHSPLSDAHSYDFTPLIDDWSNMFNICVWILQGGMSLINNVGIGNCTGRWGGVAGCLGIAAIAADSAESRAVVGMGDGGAGGGIAPRSPASPT